jgi:acyl transferase domain-containing protein
VSPKERNESLSVAVVGVCSLLPGSSDVRAFWRDVVAGRDLLTEVPPSHWLISDYHDPDPAAPDRTYARRGAFLSPFPYDPIRYGTSPAVLSATDTAQLLALPVAEGALRDATGGAELPEPERERAGVIVGTGALELLLQMACRLQRPVWLNALRGTGVPEPLAQRICDRIAEHYVPWQEATFPGLLANVVAGRIANRLDLHGGNCVVDAACASSLAALSCAMNELELGRADLMLVGGVDTFSDITMFTCFSKTPALSRSGDCRPFSDRADGTMLGEGLVFFALKRLADAERQGDRIHAVIRGLGASSDGAGTAVYAPAAAGQARALRRAYRQSGYGPRTVELVEGHGTGTPAGDAAEVAALSEVFGPADRPWCALGSAKSQFGHTKSAAGAVGLLKTVLALRHRVLPPTIKVDRPAAALASAAVPLYVNTETRPWVRGGDHPRRASVSSFGFGGSNFHVTLEEYVPHGAGRRAARLSTDPTELVLRSAGTDGELEAASQFRATDEVREALVRAKAGQGTVLSRYRRQGPAEPGKVAFLFCGQGAQYPGMGADLAMAFPTVLDAWDELATECFDGVPLHEVVFPRPAFSEAERARQRDLLTATQWAQPALAVLCVAQLRLVTALGVRPDFAAGHSLGELVALHAAGCLDDRALIALARRRGELMRDASEQPGAMLAVAADLAAAAALAADRPDVWVANVNGPGQTVLSGTVAGIEEVGRRADAAAVPVRRLATSTGFHSPLVSAAGPRLREFLREIELTAPAVPVYGCGDARPYPQEPDAMRDRIAAQLSEPVRFAEQIEAMYADGVRTFIEFGAGAALTGMVGRILDGREHLAVALDRRGRHGVTALQEALGQLAVHGVPYDARALRPDPDEPGDDAPASCGEGERARPGLTVELGGSNHGRPYPPPGGQKELAMPNDLPERQFPAQLEAAFPPSGPAGGDPGTNAPWANGSGVNGHGTNGHGVNGHSVTGVARPAGADSWLLALQEIQRQTSEAHAAYQHALADGHAAYLRTSEATLSGMMAAFDGAGLPPSNARPAAPLRAALSAPPATTLPAAVAAPPPSAPSFAPAPAAVIPRADPLPTVPAQHPDQRPDVAAEAPGADLEEIVISIIADLTGYPADMLQPDLELEHDLGIDSIKRVQILSRVRDRVPELPSIDPAQLAALSSIGETVGYLRRQGTSRQASTSADAEGEPSPALS